MCAAYKSSKLKDILSFQSLLVISCPSLDDDCQQKVVCKREEQENYLCGGEDHWKSTFTRMIQWSFTSKAVSRLACNTCHWKNNLVKWTFGGKILQGTLITVHAVSDWHRRSPWRSFSLRIIRNFEIIVRISVVISFPDSSSWFLASHSWFLVLVSRFRLLVFSLSFSSSSRDASYMFMKGRKNCWP